MKVYMGKEKQVVEVELVKKNPKNYVVRLPDGNVIIRKEKHLVKENEPKG